MAPTITSAISTFLESLEPLISPGVGLLLNTAAICGPAVPKPKLLLLMEMGAVAADATCLNGSKVGSYLSRLVRGVVEFAPKTDHIVFILMIVNKKTSVLQLLSV